MPANADETAFGVIVALPAEAAGWPDHDANCLVRVAGIGRGRAHAAAARVIERGARALLSWGVAGGLSPRLRTGDLLLPRRVVSSRGEWQTHEGWRARLLRALPDAREVDAIYCNDEPLTSIDGKSALATRGFDVVDMESAGVAQVAEQADIPFLVVKSVCDPAVRTIPALALRMLDGDGRLRASSVLGIARAGPRGWRELRVLRGDFSAACASLRNAARVLPRIARGIGP